MSLHIHADDFGINESVSLCIVECFERGWVNETSLMVNMPYTDDAVSLSKEKGFASKVGLHLNLSEGLPLTEEIKRFPMFCNSDGKFNKRFHHILYKKFFMSTEEQHVLSDEIRAQFEKFQSYGGLSCKIDSHHHIHTDWSLYRLIMPLALKYGFSSMRISATLHKVSFAKSIYKHFLNSQIRKHFSTTEEFDGCNKNVVTALEEGKDIEVMVHPMYSTMGEILDGEIPFHKILEALNV